jgi:hypothetical protein
MMLFDPFKTSGNFILIVYNIVDALVFFDYLVRNKFNFLFFFNLTFLKTPIFLNYELIKANLYFVDVFVEYFS